MKDWPKNPAFFDAARRNAETQLQAIRDGLAAAGDPLTWLRENASCVFVGANDLAALAGFLYHDARDAADAGLRAAAADTLRLLGRDNALLEKMMRKRGIPKEVLR
jgi:hypothetical protein